jgi:hypothetical protein
LASVGKYVCCCDELSQYNDDDDATPVASWYEEGTNNPDVQAEQSRAEQSRAEQSRAEQSRAEQSRAEQSRAEQSRAEQSRQVVIKRQHWQSCYKQSPRGKGASVRCSQLAV